ncbi:ABC transporter ATP-binding protein [Actinokineospora pegani]|uniref:ABC transporter ATP-binding protein n=1 Tax=Actinokineospora pegani TaxID=2654637 RepID=UPI0018D360E5|nr:ATP-binding cassette domain-containing protein [Actinokineospora pegani]
MIAVVGADKAFGDLVILDDVSFVVRPGEAVGVVGANGSGKSTLLKCVMGVEELDSGEVLLDGATFDEASPAVRAAVACLLDDIDFFPDMSVIEHLRLCAWAHGAEGPEAAAARVAEEVGLGAAQDQLPVTLSTGQRHRLGLASCFVRPRRLLVLDEPEQRLDAEGMRWLTKRLVREKERGSGLLIASHNAGLLDAVVDVVVEVGV